MAGGDAGREEERLSLRWASIRLLYGNTHVLWLSLATVISEEFPAICVQSNSLTDLDLLVNIGHWMKRTEAVRQDLYQQPLQPT